MEQQANTAVTSDCEDEKNTCSKMCFAHGDDGIFHVIYFEVDTQCVCLYATQSSVMKAGIEHGWWKENEKVYFYWCPLITTNQ